jgi:hypothetical protein
VIRTSPTTLAAQDGPWAQIRTGTVVDASGSTATVLVGATTFTASIVVPFGVQDPAAAVPAPGSLVAVGRQDASWTVFGTLLGVTGNLILDGSFEGTLPGSPPTDWTLYNETGEATATAEVSTSAVAGTQVLVVLPVTDESTSIVYSSPVAVTAGQRVQLGAFAGAVYEEGAPMDVSAELLALWFATPDDLYPATSSADTVVAAAADVPQPPPWTPLSGVVTAPVSGFVRAGLRSVVASGQGLMWDFVTVRILD